MGTTASAAPGSRRRASSPPNLLTPKQVAKILGVTNARVVAMDDHLTPTRNDIGHRRYDPAVVERVRAERAARRKRRSAR